MFVNKNAQSSSFSKAATREEAAAINSYAQKWYLENSSKKGRKRPLSPSAEEPSRVQPLSAYVSKVRVNQLTDDGPKRKRKRRKPKKLDEEVEAEIKFDPQRQAPLSKNEFAYSLPTPSETETSDSQSPPLMVVNHIPGSAIDPFACASLPVSGEILPVLQYYLNFTLLATFNANAKAALSPAQLAHSSAIESIVTGCLSNKAHMYALLSATASRMRRVSNVPLTNTRSPESFLGRAIGSIRDGLATQSSLSDKQTILDIFYLSVCEWYMNSYDAARTHFSFIRHFWKNIDPQKGPFEKYIHDMVSYNYIFLAVETGQPPFLDLSWEPDPLSKETMIRVRKALMLHLRQAPSPHISATLNDTPFIYGCGFRFFIQESLVSDSLRQILESLPELMEVYHFTFHCTEACEEESAYLSKKSQALLYRLTSLYTYGYELCITLSLIILLSCMSTSAPWRAGKVDMPKLARRLSTQLEYEIQVNLLGTAHSAPEPPSWTGKDNRMLLWIFLTGLFAAGQAPEATWLRLKATGMTRLLKIDRNGIETLMHSYVYLPSLQTATVEHWYCGSFG